MGYVASNLVADEKVVKMGTVHWGVFVPGAIWVVLGFLVIRGQGDVAFFGALMFMLGALLLVRAFLYKISTELAVTDKRVIAKFGFIRRQTTELLHSKVEGLTVNQGILGRVLNFGTVVVNGTGSGRTPIRGISAPLDFRKSALAEIESKT
jgi:uncharacterized membrane protein YdbT with pleckstrin-like domain